jgi:tetratricopeptide (TPR) repeat protein/DNA-binding CsgD family transcriptional regulator
MKLYLTIILSVITLCSNSYGQSAAEHLQNQIELTKTDTQKVNLYNQLTELHFKDSPNKARQYANKALKLAQNIHYQKGITQAYYNLGVTHRIQTQHTIALSFFMKAYKIYEETQLLAPQPKLLSEIGMVYRQQNDLPHAQTYYEKALAIAKKLKQHKQIALAYNNLGVVCFYKNNWAKAEEYHNNAITIREGLQDKEGLVISYNNIGIVYARQQSFQKALKFYHKSLEVNKEVNNQQIKAATYDNIGDVYLAQDKFGEAEKNFLGSLQIAQQINAANRVIEAYHSLYQLFQKKSNTDSALIYYQQYNHLKDSVFNSEQSRQMAEIQAGYINEKKEKEIELLAHQRKINQLTIYIIITLFVLTIALSLLIASRQRLKIHKNREILQQQQEIYTTQQNLMQEKLKNEQLAKEGLQKEIAHKNQQLTSHTLHMIKKNQLLEQIKAGLLTLAQNPKQLKKELGNLNRLVEQGFNLDKEWEEFRQVFEQVHQDFFKQLKEQYPNLTPHELHVCALVKLNFSIKEMATILGIAPNSVAMARYRIRKKLQLETDDNLTDFMMSVA